ncbi:MAG: (Fe-S)-binding protein [Candidatus Neomarinimicrobiota bacterium]
MLIAHQLFTTADYRLLQECIHCGLCLPTCPTYMMNSKESDSPRGRLALMKYLDREPEASTEGTYYHLDLCLGCLACQTACPSGVQYSHLLERARSYQRREVRPLAWLQRLALRWITGQPQLRLLTTFLYLIQSMGLDRLAPALRLLPRALRFQLAGMPQVAGKAFSRTVDRYLPAVSAEGDHQGVVAMFTGCVMDHWYADVHAATVRVLKWNSFDVVLPEGQTCCGALHTHAGLDEEAERLLSQNREAFRGINAQALVVNAAGCSAQLRSGLKLENGELPIVDIGEWLAGRLIRPPRHRLPEKITYDAPCHLYHAQGIHDAPTRLLAYACERLVPLPEAEVCCGSAGLYSLIQGEMSRQVLARKINHIRSVAPEVLVTGNPGCQMQLQAGLREAQINIPVYHFIQVLDQAYRREEGYRDAFGLTE